MRLAIMQPYLLPYIGYFQLINAVEKFVIYDDVNFIKQGWINRNRILVNGKDHIFTLKLNGASSFKRINQIDILNSKEKILKTVSQSYRKAPFYEQTMPLIQKIFSKQENNLASFLIFSLLEILKSLNIDTPIVKSSEIAKTNLLKGQDKIIYICKLLDATVYINAIGGQGLYNREAFLPEKELEKLNVKFTTPDLEPFRTAVRPMWMEWGEKYKATDLVKQVAGMK